MLFLLFFHVLEIFSSSPQQRPNFRYTVKIPAKMPRYLKLSVKFPPTRDSTLLNTG